MFHQGISYLWIFQAFKGFEKGTEIGLLGIADIGIEDPWSSEATGPFANPPSVVPLSPSAGEFKLTLTPTLLDMLMFLSNNASHLCTASSERSAGMGGYH